MRKMSSDVILEVDRLSVSFRMYEKGLEQKILRVINHLSLRVNAGEILAVAGSSGSGKSLLAHAILGILPSNARVSGEIRYSGENLTPKRQQQLRGKEITLVPQSVDYLDPLMRVGEQVRGPEGSRERQRELFRRYELDPAVEDLFPFQLSGGMARRVLLASAMIGDAKLVIADEPTPGLSPEMAANAMSHFRDLADQGCGVLLITHDIDLALSYADRLSVFYAGTTVETAPVEDFRRGAENLRHPYSKALWRAMPGNEFLSIPGVQPYPGSLPGGCLFAPRCEMKTAECDERPAVREVRGGEVACCHAS